MNLPFTLDRPLVFFDLETTGLDTRRDRIVELALIRFMPDGEEIERTRRFNPEMPIPPEATAIHGITDADVATEEPFRRRARSLHGHYIADADLAGFNVRRFDVPMLVAEFERCGIELDPKARRVIDVGTIFHAKEPRDLTAAVRFYLDRDHEDAHTALSDITVASEVLVAQLDRYRDLPRDLDGLHALCDDHAPVRTELERWFQGEGADRVFRRGKHRGERLPDVALTAPDYLEWMLGAEDMPLAVLAVVRRALEDA